MAQTLKPNRLDNRGGKREGSGRPKGIETKILTIRVAAAIHDELKAIVKRKDAEYRQLLTNNV